MTDTMTLVSEGERTVIGIELPKGKPQSKTRKVRLEPDEGDEWGPSGWALASKLGNVSIGTRVSYKIEKNAEGYNSFTKIAPVDHNQRDQTADSAEAPKGSRDDAQGGGSRDLDGPTAERDVPNTDTARFEGWAFVANCGMVELAFQELTDAVECGALDSISAPLLQEVATHLLNAADQAQRHLVGRTDRGAQSHTRARGAVRTALIRHPVSTDLSALDVWAADVAKTAERFLKVAAAL